MLQRRCERLHQQAPRHGWDRHLRPVHASACPEVASTRPCKKNTWRRLLLLLKCIGAAPPAAPPAAPNPRWIVPLSWLAETHRSLPWPPREPALRKAVAWNKSACRVSPALSGPALVRQRVFQLGPRLAPQVRHSGQRQGPTAPNSLLPRLLPRPRHIPHPIPHWPGPQAYTAGCLLPAATVPGLLPFTRFLDRGLHPRQRRPCLPSRPASPFRHWVVVWRFRPPAR